MAPALANSRTVVFAPPFREDHLVLDVDALLHPPACPRLAAFAPFSAAVTRFTGINPSSAHVLRTAFDELVERPSSATCRLGVGVLGAPAGLGVLVVDAERDEVGGVELRRGLAGACPRLTR
jgi:hypothetical protein